MRVCSSSASNLALSVSSSVIHALAQFPPPAYAHGPSSKKEPVKPNIVMSRDYINKNMKNGKDKLCALVFKALNN
jgi:hypothetical protein